MEVTVELQAEERGTRTVEVPEEATAADVVEALSYHPEAHVVIREGTPLPLDAPIEDGDEVTVLRIVSGGAQ